MQLQVFFIFRTNDHLDGGTFKTKGFPQFVFQITLIGEMHNFRVVDEQYKGRRFDFNLCYKLIL